MTQPLIAYFSMEIALDPGMPTYSGGLGVLAGDTLRAAADLRVPMVAVSLLHRKGYFHQRLDPRGVQTEEAVQWSPDNFLQALPTQVRVSIEGRAVQVRSWRYDVRGIGGHLVPVYFLDTDLPENSPWDRELTHSLYGGDRRYRLCQEAILGIGGVRMLHALGYGQVQRFHMNEGHASLLALELLEQQAAAAGRAANDADVEAVRRRCLFTTHTPVAAGHDQFPMGLVRQILGERQAFSMHNVFCCEGVLNMTYLALNLSHYVNGVAKRHGEITQQMFARYRIDSITNGVHAATWTSPAFQCLFDSQIPGWREDNFSLRNALSILGKDVWQAHMEAKRELLRFTNRITNGGFDVDRLTLGFARRSATYKRPDLLFRDTERLRRIARQVGPLQLIFAGKAHPQDAAGKELIRRVIAAGESLRPDVSFVYLPNYDTEIGRLITSGVDVWLNTPQPPQEASGTSGMKAALNGVPSLSILDGWWIEGCIPGVTGWAIGHDAHRDVIEDRTREEAASLYDRLEGEIAPMFYGQRERFIDVMRHAIALNGSFFNTHRMIQQYVTKAYLTGGEPSQMNTSDGTT